MVPLAREVARQAQSAPLLAELHAWLTTVQMELSAKSALAKAIYYTLVRWVGLTRFCDDGRIEIDNNTAERAIRPLVIGRRNYLFQGSDRGGESAAAIYTLIGTARLTDILQRLEAAIATAKKSGLRVDELNRPGATQSYEY